MITVKTVEIRPSMNVQYYLQTDQALYSQIARLTRVFNVFDAFSEPLLVDNSEDGLIHTVIATYPSDVELQAFLNAVQEISPTFFEDRQRYSDANDILIERTITES